MTTTKSIHVLFVDDNRINRKVMTQLLTHMDIDVTEAEDGYDAIEILKTQSFDMIFMDVMMPGMDGYDTTKKIRAEKLVDDSVPILAVTANDAKVTTDTALEAGMDGVMTKPLKKEDVHQQLLRFFDEEEDTIDVPISDALVFDIDAFETAYQESFLRKEIIDSFLSQTQKNQYELQQAFQSESCDLIKQKVQYIKGLCRYIYASRLLELIDTLMTFCKEDKLLEARKLEEILIEQYDIVVEKLKEYAKQT